MLQRRGNEFILHSPQIILEDLPRICTLHHRRGTGRVAQMVEQGNHMPLPCYPPASPFCDTTALNFL
ncbi:uncharacterized [Tachysurus ichikawai]